MCMQSLYLASRLYKSTLVSGPDAYYKYILESDTRPQHKCTLRLVEVGVVIYVNRGRGEWMQKYYYEERVERESGYRNRGLQRVIE